MSRLVSLPLNAPKTTLALLLGLTLFLGFFARSIQVDSSVENLLPLRDPDRLYYEEVKRVFGSEEATVIGVFAPDVFAAGTLEKIDDLSQRLRKVDGVRDVLSLSTMKGVVSDDLGVHVGVLMKEPPKTRQQVAAFKQAVLANPLTVGSIINAEGTATGIVVLFEAMSDEEFLQRNIQQKIEAATRQVFGSGPEEYAITGLQTLKVNGARLMQEDLAKFIPLAVLLVIAVLAVEFRTRRGVFLPLASVLIGVVWTTGVMVLAGSAINIGTLVLPPLLMAIGIAYATHIVSAYYHQITFAYEHHLQGERSRPAVVGATMADIRVPVAVASLTTMLGFASLIISPIRAIRDFGIYSVFGVFSIFVVSLGFIPAMLMVMPVPPLPRREEEQHTWITLLLGRLGYGAVRHRRAVLLATALVCGLGVWGATHIRVETDYLGFFSPTSVFRRDNARIAQSLGGTQPIYVVVDSQEPGSITHLETLGAISDLQQFIGEQPEVDGSLSVVDYLSVIWHVVNPDATTILPDRQADLDQLLLFVDPADFKPVLNDKFSRANIIVRTRLSASAEVNDFVARVEKYARTRFRRGITVRATGTVVLLDRSADALAHGQIWGLVQVLSVLLALMSLLFLSVRAGALSLIPNVVPIAVLFGVMGWSGITLNVSTSMIAVIAVGIAVDDTIHYLTAFNKQIHRTGDQELAILRTGRAVGRPIVFTSIALTAGFLIVCLSNFQPIRHFGLLASITMVVALLADLLITPALLMTRTIITLWDLLYVKLGPQPEKEIPLFEGLRPFQARIVVLMAHLASASPGALITRRGELKAELYVLLSGRVEVRHSAGERVIRSLGRGDVIGEMGLVRARPRSADVQVAERAEYLVLDSGFLDRIQRRYPRIAAKVFLNLTRILSDRLENTTEQLALASGAPTPGRAARSS